MASAAVTLEVTDLAGNPVTNLAVGGEYELRAYVQDVRTTDAQGVSAAFFDVGVSDNTLLTVQEQNGAVGGVLFSDQYENGHTGDNLIESSSELDEMGAFTLNSYGDARTPFFQMLFTADAAGSLTFSANPADVTGNLFNLVGGGVIPSSEVTYGDVTVNIVTPQALVDDTAAFDEDVAQSTIDVLANDPGGAGEWTIESVSDASNGASVSVASDGKSVLYTPAADFAGTETFTYTARDSGGDLGQATVTVTLTAQDDAPVNTVPGAQTFNTSDRRVVFDASNRISTNDIDVGSENLRVTLFVNEGVISLGSTTGLTFLNGSANNTRYLLFDGAQDDVNAAMLGMTYTANSNTVSDVLTIDTHDLGHTGEGGPGIDRDTIALTRAGSTGVNQPPVNSVPGPQIYDSINRTVVFGAGNAISTNDPDVGDQLMRVTLFVNNGTISLVNTTGLTFLNGSTNNSRYLLFDGTQADVNNALFNMIYTANANSSADILTIDTHDLGHTGTGGAKVDRDTIALTLSGSSEENQAPVNSVPPAQVYNESDRTVVFGDSTPITVSDPDAGSLPVRVTLFVNQGTISLQTTDGLTFLNGSANNTRYLLFDGTLDDINNALVDLTYTANAGVASDVLTIDTHDLGHTGIGGAKVDRDSVILTLAGSSINQAPINVVPAAQFYTDANPTVTFGEFNRVATFDPDAGSAPLRVTLFVNHGSITLPTTAGLTFLSGGNGTRYLLFDGSQDDINDALLNMTYTADTGATSDVFTIDTHDLGHTGTGGAMVDRDSFTLTQVDALPNQAPVNTVPPGQFYTDADPTVTFGLDNPISTFDPDAGSENLRVTLFVSNGILTLGTTNGLTFLNGSANNTRYLLFDGNQVDINNALFGLTYTANSGSNDDLLTIDTHDLGHTGTGGPQVDRDTVTLSRVSGSGFATGGASGEPNSANTLAAAQATSQAAAAEQVFAQPAAASLTPARNTALRFADLLASTNSGRGVTPQAADDLFAEEFGS